MSTQSKTKREGPYPLTVHMAKAMGQGPLSTTEFLRGVKLYQNHPYKRTIQRDVVYEDKGTELRYLAPDQDAGQVSDQAVLLIPSLINTSDILDLTEERSFMAWLAAQGFHVFLLDWGQVARQTDHLKTIDMAVDHIKEIIDVARGHSAMQSGKITVLGYCMGGTLLAGCLAKYGKICDQAVFLATPWDFHAAEHDLKTQISLGQMTAYDLMSAEHVLPSRWIQNCFFAVSQDKAVDKFIGFGAMDQSAAEAELFVAVEDWLDSGLDLPEAIAKSCIEQWYRDNLPCKGEWIIGADAARAEDIIVRSLILASSKDRLVPAAIAKRLAGDIPSADWIDTNIGHVGMMVGRRAQENVWQPILDWITKTSLS